MKNKTMKKQKGSVLVFALIVLSFILMTAFSLATVSMIEKRSSGVTVNSSTAFQNSDEGMEEFLQQLYKELDQIDTLATMGDELNDVYGLGAGGGYKCIDDGGISPARMGNPDTDFIITAYKEKILAQGVTDPTTGGWNSVESIKDCSTKLADVSRFRATGNYNNASRAVFLKLKDSLQRGLMAHWAFEDRAQNATMNANGEGVYNSFIAGDSSKNDYMLTLCDVFSDEDPANIEIDNGDDMKPNSFVVSFTGCDNPNTTLDEAMNPYKHENGCTGDDENITCSTYGAWRSGIVEESGTIVVGAVGTPENSEALYFDGNDYLTALTTEIDNDNSNQECYKEGSGYNCDRTVNYVDTSIKTDNEKLDFTKGVAISAWIKWKGDDEEAIVSKIESNEGYKLYIDSSKKLCLKLNNKVFCSVSDMGSEWAHVVAVWHQKDASISGSEGDKVYIYINGQAEAEETFNGPIKINDVPLSIGAELDAGLAASNFFKGTIDDVRVWNRALTKNEIYRLCDDAKDSTKDPQCFTPSKGY